MVAQDPDNNTYYVLKDADYYTDSSCTGSPRKLRLSATTLKRYVQMSKINQYMLVPHFGEQSIIPVPLFAWFDNFYNGIKDENGYLTYNANDRFAPLGAFNGATGELYGWQSDGAADSFAQKFVIPTNGTIPYYPDITFTIPNGYINADYPIIGYDIYEGHTQFICVLINGQRKYIDYATAVSQGVTESQVGLVKVDVDNSDAFCTLNEAWFQFELKAIVVNGESQIVTNANVERGVI